MIIKRLQSRHINRSKIDSMICRFLYVKLVKCLFENRIISRETKNLSGSYKHMGYLTNTLEI